MLRLLATAAQAEAILLKRQGASVGRAVVLGGIAGVFGLLALVLLEVAGWLWLLELYGPIQATLFLALANVAVAGLLLLMARGGRDKVAEEARQLRQQSLALLTAPAATSLPWERLAITAGTMLVDRLLRGRR